MEPAAAPEPTPQPPAHMPDVLPPRPTGWRRLWQPQRGVFWLMLGFNLLSSFMAGVLRSDLLSPAGSLVVGLLALTNALAGMWLAVRLLKGE